MVLGAKVRHDTRELLGHIKNHLYGAGGVRVSSPCVLVINHRLKLLARVLSPASLARSSPGPGNPNTTNLSSVFPNLGNRRTTSLQIFWLFWSRRQLNCPLVGSLLLVP